MAAPIPTSEPQSFTRGDTVKWTKALGDYTPAGGWTLKYYFTDTRNRVEVTATDNGDGAHLVVMARTDSVKLNAGRANWQAVVTKAAEQFTVGAGVCDVVGGLAAAAQAIDLRTPARKALEAIEARLAGKTDWDTLSVTLPNGRSIARLSPQELLATRDKLRDEVRVEEQGEAAGLGRYLRVRFGGR